MRHKFADNIHVRDAILYTHCVELNFNFTQSRVCENSLVPRGGKVERTPGVYCMRMRVNFQEILENRITNEYFRVTKTSQTYTIRLLIRIVYDYKAMASSENEFDLAISYDLERVFVWLPTGFVSLYVTGTQLCHLCLTTSWGGLIVTTTV